jgi:Sec-independent protein translocase protein TatA
MLNNIGPAGLILIAVAVVVLFGRGRVGGLLAELGQGVAGFRRGLRGDEAEPPALERPRDPTERGEA